jgi:hypothetical protein
MIDLCKLANNVMIVVSMGYIFTHWVKALFFRDIDFVVGTNDSNEIHFKARSRETRYS